MFACLHIIANMKEVMYMKNEMDYYRKRAELIGALANPYRLKIVEILAKGELCLCEFNSALDLDYSTISRHLTILKKAGIARYRKEGKKVFYSLRTPCILNFLNCFDEVLRLNVEDCILPSQHKEKGETL